MQVTHFVLIPARGKKRNQARFSKTSRRIIEKVFKIYVKQKKVPKLEVVQAFLNDQPNDSELKTFSIKQIQAKVKSLHKKNCHNSLSFHLL